MTTLTSGRLDIEERTATLDIEDQMDPVAELDGAGNVVSTFVHASKGHVPDYMTNGGVNCRIISDHYGLVRLCINTLDNSIAQRIDYDEFGNVVAGHQPRLPAIRLRRWDLRPAHQAHPLRRQEL